MHTCLYVASGIVNSRLFIPVHVMTIITQTIIAWYMEGQYQISDRLLIDSDKNIVGISKVKN